MEAYEYPLGLPEPCPKALVSFEVGWDSYKGSNDFQAPPDDRILRSSVNLVRLSGRGG